MSKLFQTRTKGGPQPLRREIAPEIRMIDEDEGLVEYVASDATLDSYREIILAEGWRFNERFRSNPVFLNSHAMHNIRDLLGRVVSYEVRDGQLVEVVKWAKDVESNADARLGWEMTVKGYLRAVSVGFLPTAYTMRSDDDFTTVADRAGIEGEDRDRVRCIYTEQQQIELSACVIGANPSALAKALECGDVAEELAISAGITDASDFETLQLAGRIIDSDEVGEDQKQFTRAMLMDRVDRRRGILPADFGNGSGSSRSASDPGTGRGGSDSTRARENEEHEAKMEKLRAIEKRLSKAN